MKKLIFIGNEEKYFDKGNQKNLHNKIQYLVDVMVCMTSGLPIAIVYENDEIVTAVPYIPNEWNDCN